MLIPVRCFTCAKIVANKIEKYNQLVAEYKALGLDSPEQKALDALQLFRYCCRRMILTQVDIIDLLLEYDYYDHMIAPNNSDQNFGSESSSNNNPDLFGVTPMEIVAQGWGDGYEENGNEDDDEIREPMEVNDNYDEEVDDCDENDDCDDENDDCDGGQNVDWGNSPPEFDYGDDDNE
jgi:DNA-directed RNA polymerase I, II, and III subunit RPABC5